MTSILEQLKTYAIGTKSELEQRMTEGVAISSLGAEALLLMGSMFGHISVRNADDWGPLMIYPTCAFLADLGTRIVRHQYATMTRRDATVETSIEIFGIEVGRTKHEIKDSEPRIEHSPGLIGTIREYLS